MWGCFVLLCAATRVVVRVVAVEITVEEEEVDALPAAAKATPPPPSDTAALPEPLMTRSLLSMGFREYAAVAPQAGRVL